MYKNFTVKEKDLTANYLCCIIITLTKEDTIMVKLRLQRVGSHKKPFYRVVVADARSPRDGRFLEIIGTYQPLNKDNQIKVDEEKALQWLSQGAQPTDTVKSLFTKLGLNAKFNAKK